MNVIHRGKPRSEQVFRGTCLSCKSVIEATRAELKVGGGDYRDPGEYGHAACPVCDQVMTFYPKSGKES